jgi:hypothetical protein
MPASLDFTPTSGFTTAIDTSAPYSLVLNRPTSLVENESLLLVVSADVVTTSTIDFTMDAGFDVIAVANTSATAPAMVIARKLATASEPSSYTIPGVVTSGSGGHAFAVLCRVMDADAPQFVDAEQGNWSTSGSVSPGSGAVTTVTADALVVSIVGTSDGRHVAAQDANGPAGYTTHFFRSSGSSSSGTTIGIASRVQAVPGLVGAATYTNALTASNQFRGRTIAIRAGAGASPVRPSYAYQQQ